MHTALSPETLDISTAIGLISTLDKYEVDIPIYGDRPLLHHAMNLYFMTQNPSERGALVKLMRSLLDKHIEINEGYHSDPDVLFKAVVIRELGLALDLAGGGGITNNSLSLTQLYSVPCDPVPLSKLLLHAMSVVQARGSGAGVTLTAEQVQALLAGASLGAGAKAAAKAADLVAHSHSFAGLVQQMLPGGAQRHERGFSLQTIMNSLVSEWRMLI